MLTINRVKNLFKMLKLQLYKRNFKKHPLKTPFPLLNSEGVEFLSLNYLNSPEVIRGCYLKISYQHLKHFLSVVSYRSGRASLQDFDSKRHTSR